tara:strand:+ start:214 stop:744 length:531 start_codon:yes stop_codon:yes gene_type:complete
MDIIGIVGLPGSGKTEISNYAREKNIPVISMGDVIREECVKRGLNPADYHGKIAKKIREELGMDAIAKLTVPLIYEVIENENKIVVDGIRSGEEVEVFRREFEGKFRLVKIESPFKMRLDRVRDRGRDNPEIETLSERDDRELGFGLKDAMESAEIGIENSGTIEELQFKISKLII